jgi:sigma-B regulation protein RsbU (phosphoserine phosphatase)
VGSDGPLGAICDAHLCPASDARRSSSGDGVRDMAFIELMRQGMPATRYSIDRDRAVIGRNSDCEIPLDVAAVSRRHAAIVRERNEFFIEDLESRNGTFLNDERIFNRATLRDGDQLQICGQTFRFRGDHRNNATISEDTGLMDLMDDDSTADARANVMATFDVGGGGSASWRLSAKPEVKLAALLEITSNLGKAMSVQEILPKVLDSLFKIFVQADRGFVVMKLKPDGPPVPVAQKHRRESDEQRGRISRTIVEEAMKSRKAILSADASSDERFSMAQSIADFSIRSMICAPMIGAEGEAVGVIQIDTMNQKSRFSDEDLEVLAGVASQAAQSIENARMHEQVLAQQGLERDLDLARRMQRALLPAHPPKVTGYTFFDYYQSARQVGGDYYDYVELPNNRFAVIVGDVAGKGVSAALLMARLSSDVRFLLASEDDPAVAVAKINTSFCNADWQDKFVTMIVAVVDPKTHRLSLVNAGHMAPILRHSGGIVEAVGDEQAGMPLGVAGEMDYEAVHFDLVPGDFVTIFTDGFSEAMNAERDLYGLERLMEQVSSAAVSVNDLGKHILEDVNKFVDGYAQSDDMCLACFGRIE